MKELQLVIALVGLVLAVVCLIQSKFTALIAWSAALIGLAITWSFWERVF